MWVGRSGIKYYFFNKFYFQQNKTLMHKLMRWEKYLCYWVITLREWFSWREYYRHLTIWDITVFHRPGIKIYQEENTVILLLFRYSNKIGRSAHYTRWYLDIEKYESVEPLKPWRCIFMVKLQIDLVSYYNNILPNISRSKAIRQRNLIS